MRRGWLGRHSRTPELHQKSCARDPSSTGMAHNSDTTAESERSRSLGWQKTNRPAEYSGHRDKISVQLQDEGCICKTQSVVLIACLFAAIVRTYDVTDALLKAALF
jgi:hypothetical protein